MGTLYFALMWVWGLWLSDTLPDISPVVWGILALLGLLGWLPALQRPGWRILFSLVAALGLAGLRVKLVSSVGDVAVLNDRGGLTIDGRVAEPPDVREMRTLLTLEVSRIEAGGLVREARGKVLVHAPRAFQPRYGDVVRMTGLLISPPVVDAFDYRDYLGRGGVGSVLIRGTDPQILSTNSAHPLAWVHDVRLAAGQQIADVLPQPYAGLLIGVLLGDDRWIAPETMTAFNRSGAAHVLVVSGYNMTLVAGALMALLSPFGGLGVTPRVLLVWAGIAAYALLVGAEPSTVRAAWMAGIVAAYQPTGRQSYLPLAVASSVIILTAYDPQVLWDRGFQLSVVATLGLAYWFGPLHHFVFNDRQRRLMAKAGTPLPELGLWGKLGRGVMELFLTTVSVLAFTTPLMAIYSGQFSWATLPVNLLIVPVQAALLALGMLAVLVMLVIAPLGQAMLWLCLPLVGWTQAVTGAAAAFPQAVTPLYLPPWLAFAYWFVVGGLVLLHDTGNWAWGVFIARRRNQLMLVGLLLMGLVGVVAWGVARAQPDGQLHVWFLDAAGGNAVLIRTPQGATVMVDGGRAPNRLSSLIGERLPPNTAHLDLLLLSTPDEAETSAWREVGGRYPPRHVLTNGQHNDGLAWRALLTGLEQAGAQLTNLTAGQRLTLMDGVTLEVLWPPVTPQQGDAFGQSALVVMLRYHDLRVLLPANLDRQTQAALTESGAALAAQVLMLPNHGQARALDSGFLQAVDPQVVVLPTASNTPPDADVLAMLGGRTLYHTAQAGTIQLVSDGFAYSIISER
jgi:competence protein ComEC